MNYNDKPQIGVSACLSGQPVRFDGGHKISRFLVEAGDKFLHLHSVCPEAELGLGIPRPPVQLRKFQQQVKLVFSKNPRHDLTQDMESYSQQRIRDFDQLDGFVFKKDSPSCRPQRVPVYDDNSGMRERNGTGIFAKAFRQQYPLVAVEDEGRLNDKNIRENFLERVYAHYRWRQLTQDDNNLEGFRNFHQNYKLVLMAKSPILSRELGQLVARVNKKNLQEIRQQYIIKFMRIMEIRPTPGQHVNVLMHILGYLKTKLDHQDKVELLTWFENYRQQQVSRVTPLVLLQHHLRRYPNDYMASQYYFSSFPVELMHPV